MIDLDKLKKSGLQLLFPRKCPVCEEILSDKNIAADNPYICRYCSEKLQYIKDPYCMKCGTQLTDSCEDVCRNCKEKKREFGRGIALMAHDDNARKILYDLKYSGKKDNADFLARETALKCGEKILRSEPDAIIPVPLHKKREFDRGFNQAELIATKLSAEINNIFGITLMIDSSLLIRKSKTNPQKDLDDRQRADNVRGKFGLSDGAGRKYQKVMLLDDIFTSGATINECAAMLKQIGIKEVDFITMSIV